jgi:hypothetical protein
VSKRGTAVSARTHKAPLGTQVLFNLSVPARVKVAITTTAHGLRRGKTCATPTRKLRRAHAKPCTRTVVLGTLTRAHEPQGRDAIAFSGRIGQRALRRGTYAAILKADNAAGVSRAVRLAFRIVA